MSSVLEVMKPEIESTIKRLDLKHFGCVLTLRSGTIRFLACLLLLTILLLVLSLNQQN